MVKRRRRRKKVFEKLFLLLFFFFCSNDGDYCTIDSCDPISNCTSLPRACPASTNCTLFTCNSTAQACVSSSRVCNDNDPCTIDTCSESVGCIYTPLSCNSPSKCEIWGCVVNAGVGSCGFRSNVTCNDGSSCTIDTCEANVGCRSGEIRSLFVFFFFKNDSLRYTKYVCPAGPTQCAFPINCTGTGSQPVCAYQNVTSLIDLCGICLGDNTGCFFSSLLGAGAIGGITGGVIAGITVAAIVAALLAIWASRKGYQYYKARSDLGATQAQNNPYFKNSGNQGEMVPMN